MKLVERKPRTVSVFKPEGKILTGSHYAINVSGGFQLNEPIKTIHIETIQNVSKHDITDCLQIAFPTEIINYFYNSQDNITISSQIFAQNITPNCILSLGSVFENLYEKYQSFINNNIGNVLSKTTLFSPSSTTIFDKYTFHDLVTSETIIEGTVQSTLTGDLCISNVNETVANIKKWNIFENRPYNTPTDTLQPFIAGDLFFIENGFSITLKTDLTIDSTFVSLMNAENADRNQSSWSQMSVKTYTSNLLIYLI